MERRYDTPESQKLMNSILTGAEWDSLDIQLTRIERDHGIKGRCDIRIKEAKRIVVATVYVSRKLEVAYVLGYHLDRKGEPSDDQLARVDEYIGGIEKLEGVLK